MEVIPFLKTFILSFIFGIDRMALKLEYNFYIVDVMLRGGGAVVVPVSVCFCTIYKSGTLIHLNGCYESRKAKAKVLVCSSKPSLIRRKWASIPVYLLTPGVEPPKMSPLSSVCPMSDSCLGDSVSTEVDKSKLTKSQRIRREIPYLCQKKWYHNICSNIWYCVPSLIFQLMGILTITLMV